MTPYEFDILLHYYGHANDHPQMSNPPPIWRGTIDCFLDEQLLQKDGNRKTYKLGERGKVLVEAALNLPLPEWKMPRVPESQGR